MAGNSGGVGVAATNNGGLQQKIGYTEGGRRRETWWRQTADSKQLNDTLKDIFMEARDWRRKSGRRGKGGGGKDVADSESNAGSDGPWYDGTETGDAQVGKLYCVDTQRR